MIFVSHDSKDRNIAGLAVAAFRQHNVHRRIFWTGDSIRPGGGWFRQVESALRGARSIVCLITNNGAGINNWINFELGAAVGGDKPRLVIICAGVNAPAELSPPLQQLQYVAYADHRGIAAGLRRCGLASSRAAVASLVSSLEPPTIVSCRYGVPSHWHRFTNLERNSFSWQLESQKEVIVSNQLVGNVDPSHGDVKRLEMRIRRAGRTYVKTIPEYSLLRRSDLWA